MRGGRREVRAGGLGASSCQVRNPGIMTADEIIKVTNGGIKNHAKMIIYEGRVKMT